MNHEMAIKLADYIEARIDEGDVQYVLTGENLITDIMNWMDRTYIDISESDDMHWLNMQYELNQ